MIPPSCKRLAEVDFPIAEVSKHAAREKSIRHGHPSTLHLWWARRPLASCRAMLLALLLPDPVDENCPEDFKEQARILLPKVQGPPGSEDIGLRQALLKFIGDFSNWDFSINSSYLGVSRGLVKAAYGDEPPLVVDPFAGGGSIPLEALRLGCEAFASDLNPVACLILKIMLDIVPRHGLHLAEELRDAGAKIKSTLKKDLAELYPQDTDGANPLAYLWARTVRCESPNCGAEIPLIRSFWLCTKTSRRRALRYKIVRQASQPPQVLFELYKPVDDKGVANGTVTRARATCLCCNSVLPAARVRAQLSEQRGGADVRYDDRGKRIGGALIMAVVSLHPDRRRRTYRLPTEHDYLVVWEAHKRLRTIINEWEREGKVGLCPIPDEPTPSENTHRAVGSQLPYYGHKEWKDLFTARQLVFHSCLASLMRGHTILPMMMGKVLRHCNAFAFWHKGSETVAGAFGRQAIPMCWDFPEYVPFHHFAGSFDNALEDLTGSVSHIASSLQGQGDVDAADATHHPLPDDSARIWFTDPPYYDAIPYADLSDFFFVWLKRVMVNLTILRDPFDSANPLSPKQAEAIQCSKVKGPGGRPKDKMFYEDAMANAFAEGYRILREDGIGSVVFAHKTTEGWEALLSGMINGGLTITGSWPIATERGARLLARDTAALATSVHLVCRPRPENAPVGDWGGVLRELPKRVGDWMERLQGEAVRGADLVFACIGPALEIFSRYSKVETAEGREIKLPEYLEKVWEVVGRMALEQVLGTAEAKARNSAAGALEEDARLSALFLWTLQSTRGVANDNGEKAEEEPPTKKTRGYSLIFDVVRRFAQPLGIHLDDWKDRIIEIEKGVVRLIPVTERAKQLFGDVGAHVVADELERSPEDAQFTLFPGVEDAAVPKVKGRRRARAMVTDSDLTTTREATTLDRIHAAMLLQKSGRTNALRALLKAEQDRSPDFLRLANALSALYPKGSEEKRLLDAMLLVMGR